MTRLLPSSEWWKLAGTEADAVWQELNPETTHVVVVERDGQIVGCHLLMAVLHLECLWIAPTERGKASVARRLWVAVQETARAMGATCAITAAVSDPIRALLTHVGALKLPGDHYVIPLRGRI